MGMKPGLCLAVSGSPNTRSGTFEEIYNGEFSTRCSDTNSNEYIHIEGFR